MKYELIGAACLAAAGGLLRSEYEKRCFTVEEFEVVSPKIRKERTIVFLTDLHNQEFGFENGRLLRGIEQAAPDLVLIGGDMMVSRKECRVSQALHLAKTLASCYPVYYGNGNHEWRMKEKAEVYGRVYDTYIRELEKAGIHYLSDRTEIEDDLAITGVNLEKRCYAKRKPGTWTVEDMERHVGKAEKTRFQILLAHSPLYFDTYREWGADLTLAGHFHGGTIRLPYLGGVMTPQYQFFLPWCAGEFEENGRKMIVGRGLGTHSIPIRFRNKPQVVVVKLKKKSIF